MNDAVVEQNLCVDLFCESQCGEFHACAAWFASSTRVSVRERSVPASSDLFIRARKYDSQFIARNMWTIHVHSHVGDVFEEYCFSSSRRTRVANVNVLSLSTPLISISSPVLRTEVIQRLRRMRETHRRNIENKNNKNNNIMNINMEHKHGEHNENNSENPQDTGKEKSMKGTTPTKRNTSKSQK